MRRLLLVAVALAGLLSIPPEASARHRMSFVPGHHGYGSVHRRYGYRHADRRHRGYGVYHHRGRPMPSPSAETDVGASPKAVPPGFKMEDGVLTYPAPARFQPKNLKPH